MAERPSIGRRVRRWLGATLASLLILAAVAMALGQLLLPVVLRHPDRVAAVLSSRIGQPVTIGALGGEWQPSGPLFVVDDLRVGGGATALVLPHAQLKVDFGAWLSPARRWLELRLAGVNLQLSRDHHGGWQVAGLGAVGGAAGTFDGALPVDVDLTDLHLDVDDAVSDRHLRLHAARLRVTGRVGRLRLGGLIDGAGGAPLRVVAEMDPRDGDAHVYAAGQQLDLAAWSALLGSEDWHLESGSADLRAWLSWRAGALQSLSINLRLEGLSVDHRVRHLELPAWSGLLQLARAGQGWNIGYRDTTHADQAASVWFAREPDGHLTLSLDAGVLDLSTLLPWLQLVPEVPNGAADWLRAAAPRGILRDVHLAYAGLDAFQLRATLGRVAFDAAAGIPGITGLDASVHGDAEAVALELPAQAFEVTVPGVFRESFRFRRIAGTLALWPAASGWRLGSDHFAFDGEGYAGSLRGQCSFPDAGAPILDVAAVIDQAEVPAAKRFWPVNVMPEAAVEWLDRALISGQVSGRAIFRGPLDDFPFPDRRGRFEAIADFDDTLLDYHPDWPKAEGLRGRAVFIDNGMQVDIERGSSLGLPADKASGRIADFDHAVLDLEVASHADAGRMLSYLRKTPVGAGFAEALDLLQAKGPAQANFKLALPLHDGPDQQAILDGQARLAGVDFGVPEWKLRLGKLKGPLHFTGDGLDAAGIDGNYGGKSVKLDVRVGSAARDPTHQLEAGMRGVLDAATLVAAYPELTPLADIARGAAAFRVGLAIDAAGKDAAGVRRLDIDSDLLGMTIDLPAPLDKPAAASLPLHLGVNLPFAGNVMDITLGALLDARLALPAANGVLGADIALGGQALPPTAGRLNVRGSVDRLDISGWLRRALAGAGGNASQRGTLVVNTRHALLDARDMGALQLNVSQDDEAFHLDLQGDVVAGSVQVPRLDLMRRGITARLDKLHWPEGGGDDEDKPASEGVSPAALPPLHVWVRDLRLGEARLGEVRFESVPIAGGMQIEQFDAQSKEVQIGARGRWSGTAAANATNLVIDISSGDLGRMLDSFGYKGLVAGGTTLAHIEGSWPGSPSAFALAAMDGSMKVHVEDGRILDVDPGVGRLFGLFSIRELPRRLSLDFGDIFESGFAFNSIDGNFAFADGNARTRNLVIRGPAAVIEVSGRTGLKAKDYDQDIVVTPHVGVALPVVGALAGGPVGAAAGLAVQTLIGKGLNRAAAAHYRITGSWDKPTIEVLSADAPRTRPARSKPSPAAAAVAPAASSSAPPAATTPAIAIPASTPVPPAAAATVPAPAGNDNKNSKLKQAGPVASPRL